MRRIICGALVALSLAVPMFADLSQQYAKWAEGPVKWLMTDEELKEWKTIRTDAAAREFVDLFWARRDPTPATPVNELKLGFEQGVEVADQRFTVARIPGSLTDRGRVLLLLGSPYRLGRTSLAPQSTHQSGVSSGIADTARGEGAPAEVWYYEKQNLPAVAGGIDFDVTFVDEYGTNDYKLVMGGRRGVNDLLLKAKSSFIFQPDLKTVPEYSETAPAEVFSVQVEEVSTEFESEYLRAAYEQFKRAAKTSDGELHVTYGEFITPSGRYYVPVQLYVPGSAGLDTSGELTFFGVVEKEDGEIVAVYEEPVTLLGSRNDAYYDRSLMLEPDEYVGTFGLARNGETIAIAKTDLLLEGLASGEPSISRLILSSNIFPLSEPQDFTDPYAFGGLKVVPKGNAIFGPREEIWYFFEVRNPGLNEAGEPTIRLKLEVAGEKADGRPVVMTAPMTEAPVQAVKDTEGHYMVGSSFPAGSIDPGTYTLKAQVFDANAKRTWHLAQDFVVVE